MALQSESAGRPLASGVQNNTQSACPLGECTAHELLERMCIPVAKIRRRGMELLVRLASNDEAAVRAPNRRLAPRNLDELVGLEDATSSEEDVLVRRCDRANRDCSSRL